MSIDMNDSIVGSEQPPRSARRWLVAGAVCAGVGLVAGAVALTPSTAGARASLAAEDMGGKEESTVDTIAGKKVVYGQMSSDDVEALFENYIDIHRSGGYDTKKEKTFRFDTFKKNLKYIDALNKQNAHALFGINLFADRTSEERSKRRMTNPAVTNYTQLKDSIATSFGSEWTEAAASGAFADGSGGESFKSKSSGSSKKSKKSKGTSGDEQLTWSDGMDFVGSSGDTTAYTGSQGEVGWVTDSDCAACNQFPSFGSYNMGNVPKDFDWRELGAVTEVKNQAYCGSCWTFSTTADIEGTHFLATGKLHDYSNQQLVSCNTDNFGCDGGYTYTALQYVQHFGGLVNWDSLPYKNVAEGMSMMNPTGTPSCDTELLNEKLEDNDVAAIGAWQFVAMGADYEDLMRVALVKNGPLSVAFNANGMDYYIEGIVGCASGTDCGSGSVSHPDEDGSGDMFTCDPSSLDHAVLAVGYGIQHGVNGKVPYWVIKNSWGSAWGEDGYYRLVRGSNACGVANMVIHSVVKQA